MEDKDLYRILVVGPTGAGKSQFCNFVQRDITNSKNKVGGGLRSCTKGPQSNIFTRNNTNYDFLDSAGSSDSDNDDIKNLNLLIDFIKKKESIDYITLLLKFGEKITNETKKYLETLGKIFTAGEFYTHLCVFFTKFPTKPKKKDRALKDETKKEINEILEEIFHIDKEIQIPYVKVYFIDTEIDEDENTYDEQSQNTIDIMIKQMKLDIKKYNSINTKNFDVTGERIENEKKQIEVLKKQLEEEKLKKEKEEEEKKRIIEEMQKMKEDDKKKKKEEELKNILKKQEEERKKYEPIIREAQERERKFQEEQRKIDEDAKNRNIDIERLDGKISDNLSNAGNMAKYGAATSVSSFLLGSFLFDVAGVSYTAGVGSIVSNALIFGVTAGAGVFALASLPLIGAGFYGLKRLAA